MAEYKDIEKNRYNERAKNNFSKLSDEIKISWGFQSLPIQLQEPYKFYHESIKSHCFSGAEIIDMCCGDGLHSFTGPTCGANLTVTDIAEYNVKLTIEKGKVLGFKLKGIVADMDNLDVNSESYDVATCAGSLSYLDLESFIPKVRKLLKEGGYFIAVDSYNHNPIYKLNRFLHFLRGNRTLRVNQNIPDDKTIELIKKNFQEVQVKYFGIFTFADIFLKFFFPPERIASIINKLDAKFSYFKKYSFKVVIVAKK